MAEEKQNTEQLRSQAALLLSQARSQAADVRRALETVRGDPALQSELNGTAAELSGVIGELETALQSGTLRAADLMAIRNIVQSGRVTALVNQAATQTAAAQRAARTAEIVAASADTRRETETLGHNLFERHIFDKYLRFTSPADEQAFRKRETEAKRYIDAQLAKHTSEGDLNAGGGLIGQMLDEHAHGAGASPDFMPRWNALAEKVQRQRAAMHAAGQKTEEFDRNLNASTRRFLKAKGLSDAQIDAALAGGKDPLEVVKPYLGNDTASRDLQRQTTASVDAVPADRTGLPTTEAVASSAISPTGNMTSIAGSLKAAGVQMAPEPHTSAPPQALPSGTKTQAKGSPGLPA